MDGPSFACESGFRVGSVTGPKVAYTFSGYPGWIKSANGTKFTVAGFWVTAGFRSGQTLTIRSFNSTDGPTAGTVYEVASVSYTISNTTRTFIDLRNDLRFAGIRAMQFAGAYDGVGTGCGVDLTSPYGMEVVIDNLMLTFDSSPPPAVTCAAAPTSVLNGSAWPSSCAGAANGFACNAPCVSGFSGAGYSTTCTSGSWGTVTGSCVVPGRSQYDEMVMELQF